MLLNQLDQFTIHGWLSLMVGMRVPHRSKFEPSQAERTEWRRISEELKKQAQSAMTVKEALEALRTPAWRWSPEFYKPMALLLRNG